MAKIYLTGRKEPLTVSEEKAREIDKASESVSGSQKLKIRASEAIVSCKFSDIKFIELPAGEVEKTKDYRVNRLSEMQLIDLSDKYDRLLISAFEKGNKYPHFFARDSICILLGGVGKNGGVIIEKYNQMSADFEQLMYWRDKTKALESLQREYPDYEIKHDKGAVENSYKQMVG